MKYLLEPAVQLMNRLKYAWKFALIGLLIVLQAAVLMYMLGSELNKTIDFSHRERVGVQYIQKLTDLLDAAQAYRSLHYDFSYGNRALEAEVLAQQTRVDAALEAVETMDALYSGQIDATWKLQTLKKDWLTRKQDALHFETERAQVAFDLDSLWLNEVIDLMQHVGYESNLAMDSEFDTSYLVDSVLRKLPGLMDTLGTAQGLAVQLRDERLSADGRNRILQLAGLMRSGLEQTDHTAQLVFRHNESIKNALKPLHTLLTDVTPIFAWNIEQKVLGQQQGLPIPQELVITSGKQAIENAALLHKEELKTIDQLLELRISRYLQYRNMVGMFTGAILLLVCYLFLGFDMSVRKAVYQLGHVMAGARNGDLNIRGEVSSRDEMGSLTMAVNTMLDSLKKMYEEVELSRAQLEVWNQELEQKVAERTASLRNLLDHAGQGFLSFGIDLCVGGEYSAECTAIFDREIAGEAVSALIYPEDPDQQVFLEAVFRKILQEENEILQETYFSLLPEKIVLGGKVIGVAYKLLSNTVDSNRRKIMLILTDRTLQKAMEERVQAEKNTLSMIVHVVTHSSEFFSAVSQYTSFCREGMQSMLQEKKPATEILTSLFRVVHTFKGTFGQLRMGNVMARLHEMEGRLDGIRSREVMKMDGEQLAETLNAFSPERMEDWLTADLEIIRDKLGPAFFQQENRVVVDSERLLEIEEKVQSLLSPGECGLLLPDLRRLRYKPMRELLQSYPEYVVALAERNEKSIHPFEIEGGELAVDPLQYNDFIKSLGHVFRNSIAHGLESFEERVEKGKEEIGRVACKVIENPNGVTIVISDDGRGIDSTRIRNIALEKELCTKEAIDAMNDEEAIEFIFMDGFSGAKEVDETAGRGVGLSAVKAELEKLGGSIQIRTILGKETQFLFFLPMIFSDSTRDFYSFRQLDKPLLSAAEKLLKQDMGLQVNNLRYEESSGRGKLSLRYVTTFLDVKGRVSGKMVLSVDQEIAGCMVYSDFAKAVDDTPKERKMENALSRYSYEIFQAAVKAVPGWADCVKAEAVVSILSEDASAQYSQAETPTWVLDTDRGKITISLIC